MTTQETNGLNQRKGEFLDMLIHDFLDRNGDWPTQLDVLQMAWDTDTDLLITMDDVNKMFN
jgi:hypothetical protein